MARFAPALHGVAGTLRPMGVGLYAFSTGWITMDNAAFIEGGEGRVRIPVISYLVDHPRGRLVFDTGMHPGLRDDPRSRMDYLADLFEVELPAGTGAHERIDELAAGRVDMIVCSHLHFDHCGGNAMLGDVPVLLQRDEWHAAHGGDPTAGYQSIDFDTGQEVMLLDGAHDVFGDGSVLCLPSPGHTAGHQSLQVTTDRGVFVLTGDACDAREMLDTSRVGLFAHDPERQRAGLDMFRKLEATGATLRFGHDVAQVPDDVVQRLG